MQLTFFIGKYPISYQEYIDFIGFYLLGDTSLSMQKIEEMSNIIFNIRLPRVLGAVMIGASLSVAGSTYQAIFVNPLVSPSILGVLAGSSFGAALGMVADLPWFGVQMLTFIFGFIAVAFSLMFLAFSKNHKSTLVLILGGIVSGSLFTALLSILKYIADPYDVLPTIVYWLMGSLSFCSKDTIFLLFIPMSMGIILLFSISKYLNLLSLGDDEAKSLGINTRLIQLSAILFATLISSLTVVLAGVIGWIGLIVPHISRMIFGADNTIVVPSSAMIGAIFLLIADTTARSAFSYEVPIGVLTSVIGIGVFTVIFSRSKGRFL